MSERKPYLLRLPRELMDEVMRWAKDDLRSFNGQIEWILREALRQKRHKALIDATAFLDRPATQRKQPPIPKPEDMNDADPGDIDRA